MDSTISFSGHVGADPQVTTGQGSDGGAWVFARFSVACTRREFRAGRWVDLDTTWMSVDTRGELARNVAVCLRRGDPVVVTGQLRTSRWTDGAGNRHDRLFVEAQHLGHDLALGRTTFSRVPRTTSGAGALENESPSSAGSANATDDAVAGADTTTPPRIGDPAPGDGDGALPAAGSARPTGDDAPAGGGSVHDVPGAGTPEPAQPDAAQPDAAQPDAAQSQAA